MLEQCCVLGANGGEVLLRTKKMKDFSRFGDARKDVLSTNLSGRLSPLQFFHFFQLSSHLHTGRLITYHTVVHCSSPISFLGHWVDMSSDHSSTAKKRGEGLRGASSSQPSSIDPTESSDDKRRRVDSDSSHPVGSSLRQQESKEDAEANEIQRRAANSIEPAEARELEGPQVSPPPSFHEDRGTEREPIGSFAIVPAGVHRWHPTYHSPFPGTGHHIQLLVLIQARIAAAVQKCSIDFDFREDPTNPFPDLPDVDRFLALSTWPEGTTPVKRPYAFAEAADIRLACRRAVLDSESDVVPVLDVVVTAVRGYQALVRAADGIQLPDRHRYSFREWMTNLWDQVVMEQHDAGIVEPLLSVCSRLRVFHAAVATMASDDMCAAFPSNDDALLRGILIDHFFNTIVERMVEEEWWDNASIQEETTWGFHVVCRGQTVPAVRIMAYLVFQAAPVQLVQTVADLMDHIRLLGDAAHPWLRDESGATFAPPDHEAQTLTCLIQTSMACRLLECQMRSFRQWITFDTVRQGLLRTFHGAPSQYHTIWAQLPSSHPFFETLNQLFPKPADGAIVPLEHEDAFFKHYAWGRWTADRLTVWSVSHEPPYSTLRLRAIEEYCNLVPHLADLPLQPPAVQQRLWLLLGPEYYDDSEPDVLSFLPESTRNRLRDCVGLESRFKRLPERRASRARLYVFDSSAFASGLPRSCLHLVQQMASASVSSRPDTMVRSRRVILQTLQSLQSQDAAVSATSSLLAAIDIVSSLDPLHISSLARDPFYGTLRTLRAIESAHPGALAMWRPSTFAHLLLQLINK
jgi:hypothetical protein